MVAVGSPRPSQYGEAAIYSIQTQATLLLWNLDLQQISLNMNVDFPCRVEYFIILHHTLSTWNFVLMVSGKTMLGSSCTDEECFTCTVVGLRMDTLSDSSSSDSLGINTECTWQKCSWFGVLVVQYVKLGIRTFPATLVTNPGWGHVDCLSQWSIRTLQSKS